MGNFSISHYAAVTIDSDNVEVRYIIDMAEIPTFQEMQQFGIDAGKSDSELANYMIAKAGGLADGLQLSIDGRRIPLHAVSHTILFPPGAGGLPTMKLGILYRADLEARCEDQACNLDYEDVNFPGRAGWKEIVIHAGQNLKIERSTAPDHDRSRELSDYPTDLVNSPPQALAASISFLVTVPARPPIKAGVAGKPARRSVRTSPATAPAARIEDGATTGSFSTSVSGRQTITVAPNVQNTPRSAFTELIAAPRLGLGIALLAAFIASGLGALHAIEPGHGKTVVAAYLVGSKGTAKHAALLGTIVTITHTAGVYLLGAITLYAQKYILPERLYPFLGVLSGLLIAAMGFYLFLERYAGAELGHAHAGGHVVHRHGGFAHSHVPAGWTVPGTNAQEASPAPDDRRLAWRQLLLLGITGGIVPCPAALVVLLSALALHRVLFGLFLIVAFSAGLAAVLIGMGMVAVYAGKWVERVKTSSALTQRWLPMTSAAMMTFLGCAIALRSLVTAGIIQIHI